MGKGLISRREIPKNEFVIEYRGRLITNKKEADRRLSELTKEGNDSYVMKIKVKDGKANWLVLICLA